MREASRDSNLVQHLRERDPRAAEQLFARYAERLTRLAEQHLSRGVAVREGGEDVVQSVFRTFFRRSAQGEFQIDSSAHLWRLLVKITVMKARAKARHHTAAIRDVRTEVHEGDDGWRLDNMADEPGPAEAAELVDQIESLLRGLPSVHCQVLEMRLAGHAVSEIATKLGVSRQTVYRALKVLQNRLIRSSATGAAAEMPKKL